MPHALLPFAKRMRGQPTDAEACLWRQLRAGRLKQYKFRRQAPIAHYIVDFVCHERKLVIEADGGQHAERIGYDAGRTAWLESQGFVVPRFWNDEILRNTQAVLETILRELQGESEAPSPGAARHPLPQGERGGASASRCCDPADRHLLQGERDNGVAS